MIFDAPLLGVFVIVFFVIEVCNGYPRQSSESFPDDVYDSVVEMLFYIMNRTDCVNYL